MKNFRGPVTKKLVNHATFKWAMWWKFKIPVNLLRWINSFDEYETRQNKKTKTKEKDQDS